jgi:hydrogenase maturation protein HypF
MVNGQPAQSMGGSLRRRRLRVVGVVQGVGFRPFVHQLATRLGLAGLVGNDGGGVFVEVEGTPEGIDAFAELLSCEPPPLARIDHIDVRELAPTGASGFEIVESAVGAGARTLVPPDVATCDDCLEEVLDPTDRRHRYPFTNCTNCGPRFTIIRDLPYDRSATTMAGFEMCPDCAAEYADPTDRRYHAQPVACPACGPRIAFERGDVHRTGTDRVLAEVHQALAGGEIVAIKGLGGYHLACDASDDDAVALLRRRKRRAAKPFAVMVPDLDTVAAIADIDPVEADVLTNRARPIVLVHRAARSALSAAVAPDNPLVGVMLPYTPLHHLLFRPVPGADVAPPKAIVLTSGNRSNEPICHDDADARERLADLADAFCTHDRPIEVPCDDSVVRIVDGRLLPVRRSRGYAPIPVDLAIDVPPVLAVGGELKNTCCVASGRRAWVGQHIGDMENIETLDAFAASVSAFCRMYEVEPVAAAADLHPGYQTRRWALDRLHRGRVARVIDVQHHHAHVASVMAEHGLDGSKPVLGFAFDGTGYGVAADGAPQMWGGGVVLAG